MIIKKPLVLTSDKKELFIYFGGVNKMKKFVRVVLLV